jgi:hypothetical protein
MRNAQLRAGRSLDRVGRLAAAALLASGLAIPPVSAAGGPSCEAADFSLWGDGRHDDTKALNAWFKGERAVWAETGLPVGPEIVGRVFRLSSTVYMPSGTGRRLEQFEMIWPARKERVSGGMIFTGGDPDKPATMVGVVKIGAGPDEGVPYAAPPPQPAAHESRASCLVS